MSEMKELQTRLDEEQRLNTELLHDIAFALPSEMLLVAAINCAKAHDDAHYEILANLLMAQKKVITKFIIKYESEGFSR